MARATGRPHGAPLGHKRPPWQHRASRVERVQVQRRCVRVGAGSSCSSRHLGAPTSPRCTCACELAFAAQSASKGARRHGFPKLCACALQRSGVNGCRAQGGLVRVLLYSCVPCLLHGYAILSMSLAAGQFTSPSASSAMRKPVPTHFLSEQGWRQDGYARFGQPRWFNSSVTGLRAQP